MSARRESERTGYFVFFCDFAVLFSETEWGVSSDSAADVLVRAFDCSICHGQGAGVGDFGGFLPSVGAVFNVCQRVGRASARDTLFFCGFAVFFSETGWGGQRLCTLSGGAFSMHASGSRGRARATFGVRSFGYSDFLKGGAGTGGSGGSLPSAATLLVRIPVDRVASVQYLYIYIALPSFSVHVLGEWGESSASGFTLSAGAFGMHASGTGKRACGNAYF